MSERTATLIGNRLTPALSLQFGWKDPIPFGVKLPQYPQPKRFTGKQIYTQRPRTIAQWVKQLPGRYWDASTQAWIVTNPGPDADRVLEELGFQTDFSKGQAAGVTCCADLATPVFALDDTHQNITWMFQRFSSVQPPAGSFEDVPGKFQVWTADLCHEPFSDLVGDEVLQAARALTQGKFAPILGTDETKHWPRIFASLDRAPKRLPSGVPDIPNWVKIELFGHQVSGTYAIIGGHNFVADDMTVGKTFSAIGAHALVGTKRLAVVAPPVSLTNWMSELEKFGYIGQQRPDGVMWSSGKKLPPLPNEGVVVVSHKLLVNRPERMLEIRDWLTQAGQAGGVIVDESHAYANWGTKQSQMIRNLVTPLRGLRVPLSGTPITAGASQLATQLVISGHLDTVFGGLHNLLTTFCRQDVRGNWVPKKRETETLREIMTNQVWIRRRKYDVYSGGQGQPKLPGVLPAQVQFVKVQMDGYNEALASQREKITQWASDKPFKPATAQIREYAQNIQIGYFSPLRKSAGLAKTDAAVKYLQQWVKKHPANADGSWDRPLVVWVHHKEVMTALKDDAKNSGIPFAVIDGSVPASARGARVSEFQAGKYAAIFCSIQAASVAINLTRSSDNLFVETSWTPTDHTQALSRTDRVGQTRKVSSTTLLAVGTVDEHMQSVQQEKGAYLDTILGEGNNTSVTGDMELMRALEVVVEVVQGVVEEVWA